MVGQTIGHYRIEARLGAGGMGVVYRARDTQLDRDAAIKLLGEHMPARDVARSRLLREARTASALNHPHICTIYEVGEAEGQVYIAMEYVEGPTLSKLISGSALPTDMVLCYGGQIADALAHAHERSIIHRDLKTANILITPDGRAKVLDFGLAKRAEQTPLGAEMPTRTALTEVGVVAGTVAYLAPELLKGASADPRTDIWALGVVLYEMVSGRMPFEGRTGFELIGAIQHEPLHPLPSTVPPGLAEVIRRCLVKDPAQRYQRASEVREALNVLRSSSAGLPVSTVLRAGAPPTRRRWLGVLVPSAVLAAGGLLTWRWFGHGNAPGVRLSNGGRPSSNQEANEYFEKGLLFVKVELDLPRSRKMLEHSLALDPGFAEARALYGLTHWLMIDQGYSNDTSWLYKAEEDLRRALQADPQSAWAHLSLSGVYLYQGRKELAPAEAEKALKIKSNSGEALHWLAHYHRLKGDYVTALSLWKQCLELEPLFWPGRMNYADTLRQQGDTPGAIRELEKTLEQVPQAVSVIRLLARCYMGSADLPNARKTLERGRQEDRRNYQTRLAWAALLALEGKRKEALQEMDEELLKFGSAHALVTIEVAEVYAALKDADRAADWLERTVRNGDERADWFRRDPLLSGLRGHPRFQQILDSIAYRARQ